MKINFNKILIGVFIFLGIFGLVQLMKDNSGAKKESLNQNLETSPAGNQWPNGWVRWSDIFEGEPVYKYGPDFSEENFVIVMPTSLIQSLPDGSSCIGDSVNATCLVGQGVEIENSFNSMFNI